MEDPKDGSSSDSSTNQTDQRVCIFFLSNRCRFGSRCRFFHQQPSAAKVSSSSHIITIPTLIVFNFKSERAIDSSEDDVSTHESIPYREDDRIDLFFAEYPLFPYRRTAPICDEFWRMIEFFDWQRGDEARKKARKAFAIAFTLLFNDMYGEDVNSLESWQKLCRVTHVDPVPGSLTECRKTVCGLHVNIADLVDSPRRGKAVKLFPNLQALRDYTIGTQRYFPKEVAKAGGVLRHLLREILHKRKKTTPVAPKHG